MALSKDALLTKLKEWAIEHETIGHALSPTCEMHSENIRGTPFEKFIGKGQAKNLFFRVPSGGGPLKNRLFLVCALFDTVVEPKALSSRLGIKASAPLRFAPDEVFDNILQIPKGSVNPFVMAQESCKEVTLLLDDQFKSCEKLIFHPMQSDFSTALSPDQLVAFLDQAAPANYAFVDLSASTPIAAPSGAAGGSAAGSGGSSKAAEPPKSSAPAATVEALEGSLEDVGGLCTEPWKSGGPNRYTWHRAWLGAAGL
mmetsp:Transcript_57390/g.136410  ORF Transcript_57390/g.136410 Transcript_57390/m.136410 type:complete len:256 (-) Transcript_57390:44-811(-)